MEEITLIATAKFGLEMLVQQEMLALGFEDVQVTNGRIETTATLADIPKLNIWLRCADRVLLKMGAFKALTFDELFDQTTQLPWEDWITQDGKFTVKATAVQSQINSARSCQSIVKKAVVERLKSHYQTEWFPETGAEFTIQVTIYRNTATLAIDTSGAGLHKRGYRAAAGDAPLKETLAAALVLLSDWDQQSLLIDPMCGSGTILIEAALMAQNMPPGLHRDFASEAWPAIPEELWEEVREYGRSAITPNPDLQLQGYDIDASLLQVAKQNAAEAGVSENIQLQKQDVKKLWIDQQFGTLVCNPPYGMRMAEFQEINQIYIALNKTFRKKSGWGVNVLTADKQFPKYFKRSRPDRIRKLTNGNINVNYYQYDAEREDV